MIFLPAESWTLDCRINGVLMAVWVVLYSLFIFSTLIFFYGAMSNEMISLFFFHKVYVMLSS